MSSPVPEPVPAPADAPAPPVPAPGGARRRWLGPGVVGVALLLAKAKWLIAVAAKAKFLTPLGSALVSVGAYALAWGWQFAIGITAMLLVHEAGHAIELKRQGVPTGPITFVPFLGAFITMKRMPKDVWHEARSAFAGPLIGSFGALAALLLGVALDSDMLRAMAYTGFFLNLFNLIPVSPLDGGRIVAAVHKGVWIVGAALCLVALVVFHVWFMLLLLGLAGFEIYRWWKGRGTAESAAYYAVTPQRRVIAATAYAALGVALALGMAVSEVPRPE